MVEQKNKKTWELIGYMETPEDRAVESIEWYIPEKQRWFMWTGKRYKCPSVMEMLDFMPDTIAQEYLLNFWKNNDRQYWVTYEEVNWHQIWESWKWFETLPNALAEMILWLHENKYITFIK